MQDMKKTPLGTSDVRIAFVVPSMHLNARRILSGVSRYARVNKNWYVRIANGNSELIFPGLKKAGIDGAFITAPLSEERSADDFAARMPCIALGSLVIPKVSPYLTANSVKAGRMAAEHFMGLGLRNFAYFSTSTLYWSQLRMKGFCDRLRESGFEPNVYTSSGRVSMARDWQAGRAWVKGLGDPIRWLHSLPKPVGLMACDDPMGYDIIEASEEAGIRIPEEVAVMGLYNDDVVCEAARPPLSSIEVDLEGAGYEAAELLNAIINGKAEMAGQAILADTTKVIRRQSSEVMAISDPQVSAALHFIRTRFHQPIQVADVVKATSGARRTLEVRFRQLLNRSILDEIMRMRIEHVADMLASTDLSVEQIAARSPFESTGYMSRLFKKLKGTSPSLYRKTQRAAAI
jgi:LacI family transcriptional regulator